MLLQERCRKDPTSYREDFLMQRRHFTALLEAARLQPSEASARLAEAASFMGCVAPSYKTEGESISPAITSLLAESGPVMHPELRRALVRLLALMRARDAADVKTVIPLFFRLLSCNDKPLRRMLHGHIISDLKRVQMNGGTARRSLQSFLFEMLRDPSEILVKRSLFVLVDLFRKGIWNDPRCANMIASACFHKSTPVAVIAARFLLDSNIRNTDEDDDDEDDDEEAGASRVQDGRKAADMWKAWGMTGKKTTKKRKRMERVIQRATRQKAAPSEGGLGTSDQATTAAMALLNDPQQFAERLFSSLQTLRKKEKYETRLIFINLLTRLMGGNHLILFEVYPYLQRYLQPAQPEVTRVLAYLTQACHDLVPGDVLHPILRGIADKFVSERSSPPAVAAGINTIRAICSRVPLAIFNAENEDKLEDEQEAPLLEDLVQYKSDRDKGVAMAARSLIALYRELQPKLLHKSDRGRMAAEAVQKGYTAPAPKYGKTKLSTGVEGIELLAESESDNDESGEESGGEASDDGNHVEAETAAVEKSGTSADGSDDNEVEGDDADADEVLPDGSREDTLRLLTDDDFARIRARQAARAMETAGTLRTKQTGDAVDPENIQGLIRRERKTLEEKLEKVIAGREGREKYGSKKGSKKGGGSSNKAKKKGKANAMVLHKRRRTNKLSRRDRQMAKNKKRDYN